MIHCPIQLALQFHPDKNGAPGADEAFKSKNSSGGLETFVVNNANTWGNSDFQSIYSSF